MEKSMEKLHEDIVDQLLRSLRFCIDNDELVPVRDFLILWNLFEHKASDERLDGSFAKTVHAILCKLNLDSALVKEAYNYIKNRYVEDGQTNWRFNEYLYKDDRDKNVVEPLLLQTSEIDYNDKLRVIAYVIYKYRCNLFHGGKNAALLTEQKDNFIMANNILLEAIREMYPPTR